MQCLSLPKSSVVKERAWSLAAGLSQPDETLWCPAHFCDDRRRPRCRLARVPVSARSRRARRPSSGCRARSRCGWLLQSCRNRRIRRTAARMHAYAARPARAGKVTGAVARADSADSAISCRVGPLTLGVSLAGPWPPATLLHGAAVVVSRRKHALVSLRPPRGVFIIGRVPAFYCCDRRLLQDRSDPQRAAAQIR